MSHVSYTSVTRPACTAGGAGFVAENEGGDRYVTAILSREEEGKVNGIFNSYKQYTAGHAVDDM